MAAIEKQTYVKVLLPTQFKYFTLDDSVYVVGLLLEFAIKELAIDKSMSVEDIETLIDLTSKVSNSGTTFHSKREFNRDDDSYSESGLSKKLKKGIGASVPTNFSSPRKSNRADEEDHEEPDGEEMNRNNTAVNLEWKPTKIKDSDDDSDIEMLSEKIFNGTSSAVISNNTSAASAISNQATTASFVSTLTTAPTVPSSNIYIHNNIMPVPESPDKRTLSSTALGQRGEKSIEDILKKISFIGYTNTTKASHAGDFKVVMNDAANTSVLIEVKNITDTVSTYEVDKFTQDLERQKVEYGIFISKKSRISGKKLVEIGYHGNTTVLYISSFDESLADPEVVLNIALYWVQCLVNVKSKYVKNESDIEHEYVTMLDDMIKECSNYVEQIDRLRKLIKKHQNDVDAFVKECLEQVTSLEGHISQVLEKFKIATTVKCDDLESFLHRNYCINVGCDVPLAEIKNLCKTNGFNVTQAQLKSIFGQGQWNGRCTPNRKVKNIPCIGNLQRKQTAS